jgi:site-specific DNA recombinase
MANRRKRIMHGAGTTARRAVLYARYSSSLQSDSWSIEAQIADLRAYCERMGWTILDDVCVDAAITGKTDERPGLERAMGLIREGRANVLVVHKLDRFFRNMAKTFEYVAELEECGAGLVCTQQPIDTTNPVSGKIVLAVMAALAEIYLDNLSEETAKGKKARAAAGLPNGIVPYGYRLPEQKERGSGNRAVAMIVPEEAEAVRLAYELYAGGQCGDAHIARTLNDRGYRFRSKWQPDGGRFNKDTIRVMLSNPFYIGWVVQPTASDTVSWSVRLATAPRVRGRHEPILSTELYERVQAMRVARRGTDPRGRGRRGAVQESRHAPYLARGIARCSVCGHRLRGQGAEGRKAHYRCGVSSRGGVCTTVRKSIPAALVDKALGEAVSALQLPSDWQQRVLSRMDTLAQAAGQVHAQRAAIERKLLRVRRLLIDGLIQEKEYREERAHLEAELARLVPPAEVVDIDKAAALLDDLAALWQGADDEERRHLAGRVVEALYCDPDRPERMVVHLKPVLHPLLGALPTCTQRVIDGDSYRGVYTGNPGQWGIRAA